MTLFRRWRTKVKEPKLFTNDNKLKFKKHSIKWRIEIIQLKSFDKSMLIFVHQAKNFHVRNFIIIKRRYHIGVCFYTITKFYIRLRVLEAYLGKLWMKILEFSTATFKSPLYWMYILVGGNRRVNSCFSNTILNSWLEKGKLTDCMFRR